VLDQLRSLDDLADYLNQIQPTSYRVNLSNWLENLFETGWQSLTALTGLEQPRLAATFRNSAQLSETATRRAKLIDLGVQLGIESVALLVAIAPVESNDADYRVEIWVQLHPTDETSYLPSNISLSLLSEGGETLQAVESRHQDNYIQLKRFRGIPGECFDIQIAFGETCTTEAFVI
ncbi:MAG: DUF1822 family protein, partial [Cyanobacteria bacterium P01_G01_bin.38]